MQGPTNVFAATNIISGIYHYYITDSLILEPNTVEWVCSNPDWIVTPLGNGYQCRIVATNIGEGTLQAITHNSTGCDTSAELDILATYYESEENVTMEVMMYPNPARSKVTIEAQNITHIRMIDVLGQILIDRSYNKAQSVELNVGYLADAVYLVEITSSVGITVRQLVIVK